MPRKPEDIDRPEIPVFGFVAKEFHACKCADSTAEKSEAQERRFFDAPFSFFGFGFVSAVKHERNEAHDGKKNEIILHNEHPFLRGIPDGLRMERHVFPSRAKGIRLL